MSSSVQSTLSTVLPNGTRSKVQISCPTELNAAKLSVTARDIQAIVTQLNAVISTLSSIAPTIQAIQKISNTAIDLTSPNGEILLDPSATEIKISTTASLASLTLNVLPSLVFTDQSGNPIVKLEIISDAPLSITSATNASPSVLTVPGNAYLNGDTVLISGATGNTAINGYRIVEGVSGSTFHLTDLSGNPINGNGTLGGTPLATRYYAGLLAQTVALGESFTNFGVRLFADGRLVLNNPTLNGGSGSGSTLNNVSITSVGGSGGNELVLTINNGLLTIAGTGTAANTGNITIDGLFEGNVAPPASTGVTAPIKLTAGTLAPLQSGNLEFDGTHLYFTIGTTRHTLV